MKATIRLMIDLEEEKRRWRWFPGFTVKQYAKAIFEGEMDVGDIKIGGTISFFVFNDELPSRFVVNGIETIPTLGGDPKHLIKLYVRTQSPYIDRQKGMCYHTINGCFTRLHTSIKNQLAVQGFTLVPKSSKIGDEPTYFGEPSHIGSLVTEF